MARFGGMNRAGKSSFPLLLKLLADRSVFAEAMADK
jgi:hypothetical protein